MKMDSQVIDTQRDGNAHYGNRQRGTPSGKPLVTQPYRYSNTDENGTSRYKKRVVWGIGSDLRTPPPATVVGEGPRQELWMREFPLHSDNLTLVIYINGSRARNFGKPRHQHHVARNHHHKSRARR